MGRSREEQFLDAYLDGTGLTRAAKECGFSYSEAYTILKNNGVEVRSFRSVKPSISEEKMRELYVGGMTIDEIAKISGLKKYAAHAMLKAVGVEFRRTSSPHGKVELAISDEEICSMYSNGLGVREIAKKIGLNPSATYLILQKNGIQFRTPTETKRTLSTIRSEEQKAEIAARPKPEVSPVILSGFRAKLADEGWLREQLSTKSDQVIAEELGCSSKTVGNARSSLAIVITNERPRLSRESLEELIAKHRSSGGSKHAGFGMLGRIQSEHQRQRAREINRGNTHNLGKKRTPEQRARMSEASIGKPGTNLGRSFSEEHKQKIRDSNQGQKRSEETRAKIRVARGKQVLPMRDTSIEVALQDELRSRSVLFETHVDLPGQPDIFVPPATCVFADGDYWHSFENRKANDAKNNEILANQGYRVLRFSETSIKASPAECADSILDVAS